MAALDTRTLAKGGKISYFSSLKMSYCLGYISRSMISDSEVYPVHIEFDGQELVLCNLSRSQHPQVNLDLLFEAGSKVTFLTTGKATIHLTGFIMLIYFHNLLRKARTTKI